MYRLPSDVDADSVEEHFWDADDEMFMLEEDLPPVSVTAPPPDLLRASSVESRESTSSFESFQPGGSPAGGGSEDESRDAQLMRRLGALFPRSPPIDIRSGIPIPGAVEKSVLPPPRTAARGRRGDGGGSEHSRRRTKSGGVPVVLPSPPAADTGLAAGAAGGHADVDAAAATVAAHRRARSEVVRPPPSPAAAARHERETEEAVVSARLAWKKATSGGGSGGAKPAGGALPSGTGLASGGGGSGGGGGGGGRRKAPTALSLLHEGTPRSQAWYWSRAVSENKAMLRKYQLLLKTRRLAGMEASKLRLQMLRTATENWGLAEKLEAEEESAIRTVEGELMEFGLDAWRRMWASIDFSLRSPMKLKELLSHLRRSLRINRDGTPAIRDELCQKLSYFVRLFYKRYASPHRLSQLDAASEDIEETVECLHTVVVWKYLPQGALADEAAASADATAPAAATSAAAHTAASVSSEDGKDEAEESGGGSALSPARLLSKMRAKKKSAASAEDAPLLAEDAPELRQLVREAVFTPLYHHMLSMCASGLEEDDATLVHAVRALQTAEPSLFSVDAAFLRGERSTCFGHQTAVDTLRRLPHVLLPNKKLDVLIAVLRCIVATVNSWGSDPIGADDLLPILTLVVVQARVPNLHTQCRYMEHFMTRDVSMGEGGYALATTQTVLQFINSLHSEKEGEAAA